MQEGDVVPIEEEDSLSVEEELLVVMKMAVAQRP